MAQGFTCPKCNCEGIGVIQTFALENAIRRRRKCPECGATLHTYEVLAETITTEPVYDYLFRKAPLT